MVSPDRDATAVSESPRNTRAIPRLARAACCMILLACGGGAEAGDGWTTERDTLPDGTVRMVNTPPDGDLRPTWRLEEELRIGAVEGRGPETFGRIKGLAVTEDGRIAVLDAQARALRIFGPDGTHRTTFGGEGEGPGELMEPYGLMRAPGDRLWVADHATNRLSAFDPDSGFVESWPLTITSRAYIWRGIVTRDGRVWKPSTTRNADRDPVLRVYGEAMQPEDTLPMEERTDLDPEDPPGFFLWEAPGGSARGSHLVPYYPQGVPLLDPQGVIWSTEPGDPDYRIKQWVPGGDTALVVRTRRAPVPVTQAERDSAIARVKRSLSEFGVTKLDWSKIPQVKPAVTNMFVADGGRLWVEIPGSDSLTTYDVFERSGRYEGTAVTTLSPGAGRAFPQPVVRGDRMWAVVEDELGVQYVVRFAVESTT